MDHRELIASLNEEQKQYLLEKSDRAGLVHLLSRLIVLLISGTWIMLGFTGWQIVLVLHGIMLIFLFTLLHETVHDTPFKTKWLNVFSARLSSFLIVLPADWFRYFHLAHHRYTNDPEKDPELEGEAPQTMLAYLWTVTGIPVWIFHFKTLFRNAFGKCDDAYVPPKGMIKVRREARAMIALYVLIGAVGFQFMPDVIVYCWVLPAILGQPFLRLYLMAEHGRCPQVANMLENTRTTFTTRFVRWLAWNMPYHAEHHAYPSVPFHRLPDFHKITREHLHITEDGYSRFHAESLQWFSSVANES